MPLRSTRYASPSLSPPRDGPLLSERHFNPHLPPTDPLPKVHATEYSTLRSREAAMDIIIDRLEDAKGRKAPLSPLLIDRVSPRRERPYSPPPKLRDIEGGLAECMDRRSKMDRDYPMPSSPAMALLQDPSERAFQAKRSELRALMETTGRRIRHLSEVMSDVRDRKREVMEEHLSTSTACQEGVSRIRAAIDLKEKMLIAKLDSIRTQKNAAVDDATVHCRETRDRLEALMAEIARADEIGGDPNHYHALVTLPEAFLKELVDDSRSYKPELQISQRCPLPIADVKDLLIDLDFSYADPNEGLSYAPWDPSQPRSIPPPAQTTPREESPSAPAVVYQFFMTLDLEFKVYQEDARKRNAVLEGLADAVGLLARNIEIVDARRGSVYLTVRVSVPLAARSIIEQNLNAMHSKAAEGILVIAGQPVLRCSEAVEMGLHDDDEEEEEEETSPGAAPSSMQAEVIAAARKRLTEPLKLDLSQMVQREEYERAGELQGQIALTEVLLEMGGEALVEAPPEAQLVQLRKYLAILIKNENYQEAAWLNDEIKLLEQTNKEISSKEIRT